MRIDKLQEAINSIESANPNPETCSSECPNAPAKEYKGKKLCYPHYLAATADGQLFNTNLRKERGDE